METIDLDVRFFVFKLKAVSLLYFLSTHNMTRQQHILALPNKICYPCSLNPNCKDPSKM